MKTVALRELLSKIEFTTDATLDTERRVYPTSSAEGLTDASVLFITKKSGGGRRSIEISDAAIPYAVVCEADDAPQIPTRIITVKDARRALSTALANYYEIDFSTTQFIGITGTNGKTTVAETLFNILRYAGHSVGIFGTGVIRYNDELLSDKYYSMTTPDPEVLYFSIAQMQEAGCDYVIMEVSSHALKLGKIASIPFKISAFTNLSREHQDFHPDTEDYYLTKLSLFKQSETGIFNLDCPYSSRAYSDANCKKISVGVVRRGDVYATDVQSRGLGGTSFYYREDGLIFGIDLHAPGGFNVYNALMALKCAIALGIRPCIAKQAVNLMEGTPGRMEALRSDIDVLIDYAHTPLAFENTLKFLNSIKKPRQRLFVVFGCGGNRDRSKRSEIASVAAKYADVIIITEDNSRLEDKENIFRDILLGIPDGTEYSVIPDREKAIEAAICSASRGDVIAILGKGREGYIIDADGYRDWSDKQTVLRLLGNRC